MLTHPVHQCEFCGASFCPRPQVKKPRACARLDCQKKRQRSNELDWRDRNSTRSDPHYHRIRKQARLKQLKSASVIFCRCFSTGATLLGEALSVDDFEEIFFQLLMRLGLRRVNKLWLGGIPQGVSSVNG